MSEQRNRVGGYTIVEALMFLAVTGALFISAATLISGQQARTEFTQSIRDIESRLRDVANDVSTGYYANTSSFQCTGDTIPGSPPNITAGSGNQGANAGCIFLGRAIHFAPFASERRQFSVHTVVGKQRINNGGGVLEVQNLNDAEPRVIPPALGAEEVGQLSGGVTIERVRNVSTGTLLSGVAFLTTLSAYESGVLQAGSSRVNVFAVGGDVDNSPAAFIAGTEAIDSTTPANPAGGIEICIQSNNGRSSVLLTLGGNNRQLTTNTVFQDAPC